jgi:hypothetical protein
LDELLTAELSAQFGAEQVERWRRDGVRNRQLVEQVRATHAAYRSAVQARHERLRELVADGWTVTKASRQLGLSRQAAMKALR